MVHFVGAGPGAELLGKEKPILPISSPVCREITAQCPYPQSR